MQSRKTGKNNPYPDNPEPRRMGFGTYPGTYPVVGVGSGVFFWPLAVNNGVPRTPNPNGFCEPQQRRGSGFCPNDGNPNDGVPLQCPIRVACRVRWGTLPLPLPLPLQPLQCPIRGCIRGCRGSGYPNDGVRNLPRNLPRRWGRFRGFFLAFGSQQRGTPNPEPQRVLRTPTTTGFGVLPQRREPQRRGSPTVPHTGCLSGSLGNPTPTPTPTPTTPTVPHTGLYSGLSGFGVPQRRGSGLSGFCPRGSGFPNDGRGSGSAGVPRTPAPYPTGSGSPQPPPACMHA